jgi:hypothetical protein
MNVEADQVLRKASIKNYNFLYKCTTEHLDVDN